MVRFEVLEPKAWAEVVSLLSQHKEEAKILAGGQSLLVLLKYRLITPRYLINIKGLSGTEYIAEEGDGLRVGALTTHRALETSPTIRLRYPILAEAEQMVASVQVRNWGTIGGNLCHADPASDPATALIALGSRVKLAGVRGTREMEIADFFVDYMQPRLEADEILQEIKIPAPSPRSGGAYHKESLRKGDRALAGVAVMVTLEGTLVSRAVIVLAGVGTTPVRATEAESLVVGHRVEDKLIAEVAQAAAREAEPISDVLGSAEYKREMVKVAARQALKLALERAQAWKGGER